MSRHAPSLFCRMVSTLASAAFILCLPGQAVAAAAQPETTAAVATLVGKVMAAYGGEAALKKIATVYAKGVIETVLRQDGGTSTRYFKRPRKLRAELAYKNSSETRILSGFRGWRGSSGQALREVHGPPYLAMAYQAKYLDLPFGFLDKSYSISHAGSEQVDSVTAQVLRLEDNEGTVMRVYIDPTGLIIRVAGSFTIGSEGTELVADFSDFRNIEGIKFPHRIANYSGRNKIAETAIQEIKLNREMPDQLFQP